MRDALSVRIRQVSTFWVASAIFLAALYARAEIYRFEDKDGVVHFTNVPTDDPRYKPIDRKSKARRHKSRRGRAGRKINLPSSATRYDAMVNEASRRFNMPRALISAVMAVESNFNPEAVSRAGAQGLMQLMPATAREMGVEDAFDPRQNILGGTRYLRLLANSFDGDLVLTLAAYNAGQEVVNRHMDIPPFQETQRYVRRVLRLYYSFKNQIAAEETPSARGRKSQ
ncbi:MAG TPA: lytic transglycosylase domain-containing protein [Myxococcota bacterium]|nr:lytic transglycosylase domain-containing protein [Myxococcota bacterium]